MFRRFSSRYQDFALPLLRIVTGVLFLQHGMQKLFGWFGGFGSTPGATAPLFSLMGVAGLLEVVGGLAIVVGAFTHVVAFVLSGMMAVAYFMAHAPRGFWPIQNEGELAVLYAFIFLYLATAGGGRWSLDRLQHQDDWEEERPPKSYDAPPTRRAA
ncbi:MAG: DoxX family protein [Deltaproteobacteria bacterium]|nr:DoxX family protein [Deltaproteobacteria bacterium]